MRSCRVLLAALVVAIPLAGCAGSSGSALPRASTPTATSSPHCPAPATPLATQWPAKVPADLPKPPNADISDTQTASDGVYIVKFTTPTSLRESVIFVVTKFPKAGYQLGRGDAEATEADAPFVHGDLRGLIRMLQAGECRTQWLLATVNSETGPTSPLLPTRSPSGSPSPLPFG